jgi:hypothetical protein
MFPVKTGKPDDWYSRKEQIKARLKRHIKYLSTRE